jgi:ABC-type nickel/cobalt efflux system permease component RcnA
LLGLLLLCLAVREWLREARAEGSETALNSGRGQAGTLAAIVVGSGMVPCPGAALLLTFCLSQNLPWTGVLSVFAMSAGMAVVSIGVSLAAVVGKQRLLAFLTRRSVSFGPVHHIIEIAGALLMTGFGLLMLSPWLAGMPR